MDLSLYRISLCAALPLMLFFGFHMLLAPVSGKRDNSGYLQSRRFMGVALLVLAVNYVVHFIFAIRFRDTIATILINMVTYFLCYWLFTCGMMTLLDRSYVSRRRFVRHMLVWSAYSIIAFIVSLLPGMVRDCATAVLAGWLLAYGLLLARCILSAYHKALRLFENTRSDDLGAYIRWLSVFTYLAVGYGVSCCLLTFLPQRYVFVWILSAIPFYIYLYCCYHNYLFFHANVEDAMVQEQPMAERDLSLPDAPVQNSPLYHADIAGRIEDWVDSEGYRTPGITLNELSLQLGTNRTYLSEYINGVYSMSFRDWISGLRVEYAKRLMKQNPQLKIQEISESAGFLSVSHFSRTFSDKEGCSPARWRNSRQ